MAFLSFNWLIHLAVVASAYLLHRQIGLRDLVLAALLFGVHPIVAEPVHYVSARSESLAALGAVCPCLLCVRAGDTHSYRLFLFVFDGEGERGRPAGRIDALRTSAFRAGRICAGFAWLVLVCPGRLPCFYAVAAARGTTRSSSAFAGRARRAARPSCITQSSCWACSPKVLSINLCGRPSRRHFYPQRSLSCFFPVAGRCWLWRHDRTVFFMPMGARPVSNANRAS